MFLYLTLTSVYIAVDFKPYTMMFEVLLDITVIDEIASQTKKQ